MKVERLGYAAGARVTGIDLRAGLSEPEIAAIRAAWLDHHVLAFPGQDLSPPQLAAFGRRFGELDDNRSTSYRALPEDSEVVTIKNEASRANPLQHRSGQLWHSDRDTTETPTSVTILVSKILPEVGGNTLFANQYMAWDALSSGMQDALERLESIVDNTTGSGRHRPPEILAQIRKTKPPVVQPAVRVHPETGRKALYVGGRIRRFKDWSESESRPLVEYLLRHAVQDEFVFRYRWTAGDLVMWDNRCLLHKAPADYDVYDQPRLMIRTSVLGHKSGYRFLGDSIEPVEMPAAQAAAGS